MSKNNKNYCSKWKKESNFSAQHLLISKRLIHDMITLARIRPTDTVLDIGAGTGALTYPLAEKAAHVLAIETDPALIDRLFSKMQDRSNIRIKQSDFLKVSLPGSPFTVVANIPYSITTPIMGRLLDQPAVPLQRAVLLVEKGAAQRFTAIPVTDPRNLSWRMQYDIRLVRTVSPHHFAPPRKWIPPSCSSSEGRSLLFLHSISRSLHRWQHMDCEIRGYRYLPLYQVCLPLPRLRSWPEN